MARRPPRWLHVAVALAGLLVLAGVAGVAAADGTDQAVAETDGTLADRHIQSCAADPPDDYADPDGEADGVIGWVDGYWYNEPLGINISDGLTQAELDTLAARTAARFEAMRCLDAEGTPPVEIQTREEFEARTAEAFGNVSEADRLFDNAKFEAMLAVSSEADSIALREANRATSVGGFYNFEEDRIVVVSDSPDSLRIDEEVLAHEVGHAIQDQRFNLSRYDGETSDTDIGTQGLTEGDVSLVEYQYLQACEEGQWEQPCLQEDFGEGEGDGPGEPASWALYFNNFQPYSDGPTFIEHVYEEGGWEAVNAAYDDPPRSSAEVIDPEAYGEFEPANITVPDRSDGDWERLTFDDGPNYDVIGQAGITATFMQVPYETQEQDNIIIQPQSFLNLGPDGEVDEFDPLEYDHPETDSWRNDRLYAYRNGNETGAVWKLAWANGTEADQFVEAYRELVAFRGGEAHPDHANVYTFENAPEWDMAVAVETRGDRVVIVTAPTVDDLTAIHDVALVDGEDDGGTTDGGGTGTDGDGEDGGETDGDGSTTGDDGTATDEDGPGFGIGVAVAGITGALLLARRVG